MTRTLLEELTARGFVASATDPDLGAWLEAEPRTMYVGYDPTATSLHLGNLVPIMGQAHFQRHGHRVLALVGGATGMVGDPSGRSSERNLLTLEEVARNSGHLERQLAHFLAFAGDNPARMLDNNSWIGPLSFTDWLRDVGKHFTLSYMLAKDSVKSRLQSESGITYTEFSYMTMQAYDFLHLSREHGCLLQAGGNDQWGNITAGIELIRKVTGEHGYGLTFPLITTASGEKFGKSADNAVWLDADATSPFQFYQYLIRTDDNDVERFLKLFTFLDLEEIELICREHQAAPEGRSGQQRLAEELTLSVHGQTGLDRATRASQVLYGSEISGLSDADLGEIFADVPAVSMSRDELGGDLSLTQLAVASGLCASRAQARRLVEGGGLYLNNLRIEAERTVGVDDLASPTTLVLRSGKRNYTLVRFS